MWTPGSWSSRIINFLRTHPLDIVVLNCYSSLGSFAFHISSLHAEGQYVSPIFISCSPHLLSLTLSLLKTYYKCLDTVFVLNIGFRSAVSLTLQWKQSTWPLETDSELPHFLICFLSFSFYLCIINVFSITTHLNVRSKRNQSQMANCSAL